MKYRIDSSRKFEVPNQGELLTEQQERKNKQKRISLGYNHTMKIRKLTAVLFTCFTVIANAQYADPIDRYPAYKSLLKINKTSSKNMMKGTATAQRLIAQTMLVKNPNPTLPLSYETKDSVSYAYNSNNRGSSYNLSFITSPWNILATRTIDYSSWPSTPIALYKITNQEYNQDNQPTVYRDSVNGQLQLIETKTYNTQAQLIKTSFRYMSITQQAVGVSYHTYNAQGLLSVDSAAQTSDTLGGGPYSSFRTNYFYNSDGNPVQIIGYGFSATAAEARNRTTLSYDVQQRVVSIKAEEFDGTVWTVNFRDSFVYASGNSDLVMEHYNIDNSYCYRTRRFVNANGITTHLGIDQSAAFGGPYTPIDSIVFENNSFGNPVRQVAYSYDNNNVILPNPARIYNYFYEEHATSIPNNRNEKQVFILYPNPARNTIHIAANASNTFSGNDILVTDITGRIQWKQHIQTNDRSIEIPVSEWASGNYYLSISNSDGKTVYSDQLIIQ